MASDDWEEAEVEAGDASSDDPQGGAQASLDKVLRDAAEARDPDDGDDPGD